MTILSILGAPPLATEEQNFRQLVPVSLGAVPYGPASRGRPFHVNLISEIHAKALERCKCNAYMHLRKYVCEGYMKHGVASMQSAWVYDTAMRSG